MLLLIALCSVPLALLLACFLHSRRVLRLYDTHIATLRHQAAALPPGTLESDTLLADAAHLALLQQDFSRLGYVERVMTAQGDHSLALAGKQAADERRALLAQASQGEIAGVRLDSRISFLKDGLFLALAIPAACLVAMLVMDGLFKAPVVASG